MSEIRKESINDRAVANKIALICYTITSLILLLAYVVELFKGARTIQYFMVFIFLNLAPLIWAIIAFKRNPEKKYIRSIIGVGYAIFYTFVIFTSTSQIAFVYVLPMMLAIGIYADKQFSLRISVGAVIVNGLQIAYEAKTIGYAPEMIVTLEIRIIMLILCGIYMILVNQQQLKLNNAKLEAAELEKNKSDNMLEKIIEVSDKMANTVVTVTEKMDFLKESLNKTMMSMQEVTTGTTDTVNAVQNQLEKTEEIQSHINDVSGVSQNIVTDMQSATDEIAAGKENVTLLVEQAQISEAAGSRVAEELSSLMEYAKKMGNIISAIENVTEQTSLLSLNASIEAARAGEAGRGFAVVASEISTLSGQTQSATVEITELINDISAELNAVVNEINKLMDSNKMQSVTASKTAESFESIESVSMDINSQSSKLAKAVALLADANEGIVQNIQTISAITEEVTAHSSETYSISEENGRTSIEVAELVTELNDLAKKLKQE